MGCQTHGQVAKALEMDSLFTCSGRCDSSFLELSRSEGILDIDCLKFHISHPSRTALRVLVLSLAAYEYVRCSGCDMRTSKTRVMPCGLGDHAFAHRRHWLETAAD